jgi:hypothetical protein
MSTPLFYYQHSRKKTAFKLLMNMALFPLYLVLLKFWWQEETAYIEFYQVAIYIVIGVEIVLAALCVWFFTHPALFEIIVREDEFTIHHATFKSDDFSIHPNTINKIEHVATVQQDTYIIMQLNDGTKHYLSMNYRYSRKKLYAALAQANPAIELPDSVYRFTRR